MTSAGTAPLTVHGVQVVGSNASEIAVVSDECSGRSLPVGEHCGIDLELAPAGVGLKQATLQIADDAPGNHQVALTGTGTSPLPPAPPPTRPESPRPPHGLAAFARGTATDLYLACTARPLRIIDLRRAVGACR